MTSQPDSLLISLASFIGLAITIYMWVVIIRVLISWVNPNPYNPVVKFLAKVTDPVLFWVRRAIPLSYAGIDFSPVILILLLVFLHDFLVFSIMGLPMGIPGWQALRGVARGMPAMGIFPIFLISLIRLVQGFLSAYMIVVIIRAVLSWISPDPYNPVVRFIYALTEPVMYRLRSILPLAAGGIDFTPIVLIAGIYLANMLLSRLTLIVIQAFV